MATKQNKLPSLSRVVPGAVATLELQIGPTYQELQFEVTAAAGLDVSDIGEIKVLANGQEIQRFKNLDRLIDLNTYWGRGADSVASTYIGFAIHFFRAEFHDLVYRRAPGMGTADLQTLHLEIAIASGAPADIKIAAYAKVDPIPQPSGVFYKVREFPFSSSVAGQVEVDKLPRGAWYSAIHLFKSDVSAVEVQANSVKVFEGTKTVLERFQKNASPKARVPVTAEATHIDFVTDGDMANSLRTDALQDFRLLMTLGTSGAVDIVTETLDTLAGA